MRKRLTTYTWESQKGAIISNKNGKRQHWIQKEIVSAKPRDHYDEMRTYQANTQKIRPGKHRILGDKSWSEDWRWLIGNGGLQRRDCSGGRWALATVVSVTKNRSVCHIRNRAIQRHQYLSHICHISFLVSQPHFTYCHRVTGDVTGRCQVQVVPAGWQLMWQVDVRCKLCPQGDSWCDR
jgi:ferredoxin-like protein FixX